jgi:predicted PurR-regulated permease PerM/methanogenic corrinoid protein MtbC1
VYVSQKSEDTQESISEADHQDTDQGLAVLWTALPIVAIVFATATLYRGRDVLLPITMALILAVIFTPLASCLERYVGRVLSAALAVLLAVTAIGAIGYFLAIELTAVADEVAGYSDNIGDKLAKLETTSPPWLQHLKHALSDIQRRVQQEKPAAQAAAKIQALPTSPSLIENVKPVIPVVDGIVESLLITVLLFFLLYSRDDLRDRFVRLVARARITVVPQALETAAQTVGHYLMLFSLTNLGFGLACGLAAWLLGLPRAPLWALLAFLLRFIPYVGAVTAAFLPALVAFAIFPGWSESLEVIAAFVLFDQIASQFIEPFVVGPGIDVSPVALLVSAMYWSWLWGLPGLLLATPLTACLKVAGDYIPALGFLSVLLGASRELDHYHEFYRMILELDITGARELTIRYCDKYGMERTFDEILMPVLSLGGEERAENHISEKAEQLLIETVRELIEDLGNRYVAQRKPDRLRVLGVFAPGEVHNLGLLMIIELLRHSGASAKLTEEDTSPEELRTLVKKFAPELICFSCTMTECLPNALETIAALRRDFPKLTIFAGGRAALWDVSKMLKAGCDQVCGSREEARRALRQFAVTRARSRETDRHVALTA